MFMNIIIININIIQSLENKDKHHILIESHMPNIDKFKNWKLIHFNNKFIRVIFLYILKQILPPYALIIFIKISCFL